jgi:hypothetical protein
MVNIGLDATSLYHSLFTGRCCNRSCTALSLVGSCLTGSGTEVDPQQRFCLPHARTEELGITSGSSASRRVTMVVGLELVRLRFVGRKSSSADGEGGSCVIQEVMRNALSAILGRMKAPT